jgi:hypothetical protein
VIRSATIALALAVLLVPVAAFAQTTDQDQPAMDDQSVAQQSVMDRARPDYDPIGQRVGGFILYPQLDLNETYDSNINATSSGQHGDFITSIQPQVQLKSDWNQNALNFHANSDSEEYAEFTNNDYTNYGVGGDGRLDIYHDARLFGSAGYNILHLPWWSPNTFTGQLHPTEYSDTSADLAGEKQFNHLSFRLEDGFDRYNFQNVTVDGASIAESRNNYDDNRLDLTTTYEIVPGRDVYVHTGYDWRMYDSSTDLFGYNRNSTGYIAALGTRYDVTGLTFLDAYLGYREQDYDDARLGSIGGPTGGLKLTWNVTPLTTITGNVTRDIDETVIAGAAGYFATVETVRADHELLRNVLLNASFSHESDDFSGIDRTDDYYIAKAGVTYLLNENFRLTGGYTYETRNSTIPGNGASDNQVFLGISARL